MTSPCMLMKGSEKPLCVTATPGFERLFVGHADGTVDELDWFRGINDHKQPIGQPRKFPRCPGWSTSDSSLPTHLRPFQSGAITSLAVHREAMWLLGGSATGLLWLWSVRLDKGKCVTVVKLHTGMVASIAVSDTQQWCFSGGSDGALLLTDLNTGQPVHSAKKRGQGGKPAGVKGLAAAATGTLVLGTFTNGLATLWDIRTAQFSEVARLASPDLPQTYQAGVTSAAWGMGVCNAYLGYRDGVVREWDFRMIGKPVHTTIGQTMARSGVASVHGGHHEVTGITPVHGGKLVVSTPAYAAVHTPGSPAPACLLIDSEDLNCMTSDKEGRFLMACSASSGWVTGPGTRCLGYDLSETVGLDYPALEVSVPAGGHSNTGPQIPMNIRRDSISVSDFGDAAPPKRLDGLDESELGLDATADLALDLMGDDDGKLLSVPSPEGSLVDEPWQGEFTDLDHIIGSDGLGVGSDDVGGIGGTGAELEPDAEFLQFLGHM